MNSNHPFLEGVNKIFRKNVIGVSATKIWEKSRIFRYGLPEDFLSKGQKTELYYTLY